MDEPANTDSSKIVAICYAKRTPPIEQIHIAAGRSLIPRHGAEHRRIAAAMADEQRKELGSQCCNPAGADPARSGC